MTIQFPSKQKQLNNWDASRQQAYRAQHQETVLTFHFLLDASPSMAGKDATNLRHAYNMYLGWLQRYADPMSLADVRCFSTPLDPSQLRPLGSLNPLTAQTYDPMQHGSGTALYRAVGETASTADPTGQHILVVFTDGMDNTSGEFGWAHSNVYMLLQMLQREHAWLGVFLGAFPEALEIGKQMGFQAGNCLVFTSDKIPEAFETLRQATQRYLAAPVPERKLLAQGGIF